MKTKLASTVAALALIVGLGLSPVLSSADRALSPAPSNDAFHPSPVRLAQLGKLADLDRPEGSAARYLPSQE